MSTFVIEPQGRYSLRESVEFGFGQRDAEPYEGVMRLAFVLDGYAEQVGVVLRQDDHERVTGEVVGDAEPEAVRAQVARILSLDHDGRDYEAIGERDPVIGRLQTLRPGLRPPLFHSPYEGAMWSILSARRPGRVAAGIRERLSRASGRIFELDGVELAAVPTPRQLLEVAEIPSLPADRVPRLHAVAELALAGGLDADRLLAMGPEEAATWVQQLPGIGPFYASLIAIRATGFVDVLPDSEPRLLELVRRLYDLPAAPDPAAFATLAEPWRPMRTWAAVLIRAAGADLAAPSEA